MKHWLNYLSTKYWYCKLIYQKNHWKKILSLLTWNDFKNILGLEYRINFLTNKKIIQLLTKKQIQVLVFIYNKEVDQFYQFHQQFIYMDNFDDQKNLKLLDKNKKYVILGFWRNEMIHYRWLKNHNFKVYLQRKEKEQ
ncbi:hypothetical protein MCAV_00250 [[Mycoplasma] cavipharyngis]|uniref:hypothetical protein n=1 Tax=[Mycoplasma] cavipharyngis TaxID=92757 RepID=UPI0037049E27